MVADHCEAAALHIRALLAGPARWRAHRTMAHAADHLARLVEVDLRVASQQTVSI
jgi:hypothetical protein